jgi:parallel beta-helix repeat protein
LYSCGHDTLSSSIISDNTDEGVTFTTAGTAPAMTNNTFENNGTWPIRLYAQDASKVASNNVFTGNTNNGIYVFSDSLPAESYTWSKLTVPYCVYNYVQLNSTVDLTIEPGAM